MVHSFRLPRTDGAAGGSERDGADRGTMQLPSLGGHKQKNLERQYLKANLLKCMPPLTMRQHTLDSRFPLTGKWKSLLHIRRGSAACLGPRPGQRPEETQFIFKAVHRVFLSYQIHPRYHREKGKSVKTAGSLTCYCSVGTSLRHTLSMRLGPGFLGLLLCPAHQLRKDEVCQAIRQNVCVFVCVNVYVYVMCTCV